MSQKPSVLVVDDESGILDTLRILLRNEGFEVTTAQGGKAGLEQIRTGAHDLILSDVRMPQVSGLDILNAAREQDPMTPVILMTAQASLQSAIQAVNSGAFYYIQKPFSNDELVAILRRAAEHRLLRVENKSLKQEIRRRDKSVGARPVGNSRVWLDVLRLAETVAPTESTVLVTGESGTGKEVVARYIHELSSRAERGFQSINCGALPESLLESELFGHVKGSFTGAVRDKQGLFAAAHGDGLVAHVLAVADERPLPLGKALAHGVGRVEDGPPRYRPSNGPSAHRRAEEIAGAGGGGQRRARKGSGGVERRFDAEVGPAIRRDEKRPLHSPQIRTVVALIVGRGRPCRGVRRFDVDEVRAERSGRGHVDCPLGAAPAVERQRASIDFAGPAVANDGRHARAGRQQRDAARGGLPEDRLDVQRLAEPVDAAIGEHRSADRAGHGPRVVPEAELPGRDAFVPVAGRIRDVAVLLGHRDERQLPRPIDVAQADRRHGDAIGARRAAPRDLLVGADERHSGAGYGRGVVEARHEHQRPFRRVLHRQPEVRDLHERRLRRAGRDRLRPRDRRAPARTSARSAPSDHLRPALA